MIKTVFFDLDDTLYSFKGTELEVKAEMKALELANLQDKYTRFLKIKKELTKGQKVVQEDRRVWFKKLLKEENQKISKAEVMNKKYWTTLIQGIEPFYDFKKIEPKLRKKYKLGIITDGIKKNQLKRFNALGLKKFDYFITSEEIGVEKPNLKIFQAAIKKANCKPNETAMIGDNPDRDIIGAKKAGMKTIRLKRGYYTKQKSKADYEIENYEELMPILEKI